VGALLAVPQPDALLCFLSHGCVFPELWVSSSSDGGSSDSTSGSR
jgi:hypothetical protein